MSQRKIGALLSYINVFAKNIITLVYTPILLSHLGQAEYGLYQLANSVISCLFIFGFGFSSAYIRFYTQMLTSKDQEGIQRLNGLYLLLFLGFSFISIIGLVILIQNLQMVFSNSFSPDEILLTRTLMIIVVFNVALAFPATVFDSYVVAHEQFKFQKILQLLQTIIVPLLTIPLLFLGHNSITVLFVITLSTVIFLLVNSTFAIGKLKMRFSFRGLKFAQLKEISIFSSWILLNQITDIMNNNVPNFILGMFAGAKSVAVYAIALQIKMVFITLSWALAGIFIPKINDLVARNINDIELTKLMTNVGRYQLIVQAFFCGGFIVIGKYFIAIWAGEEYLLSYYISVLLVISNLIPHIQNIGIEIQRAKNKHCFRSFIYIIFAFMNFIITILLVNKFGALAPTIGYIVSITLSAGFLMNWYYYKHIGIDIVFFWKANIPIVILTVVCVLIGFGVQLVISIDTIWSFLAVGLFYSILFTYMVFRFILSKDEIKIILEICRLHVSKS